MSETISRADATQTQHAHAYALARVDAHLPPGASLPPRALGGFSKGKLARYLRHAFQWRWLQVTVTVRFSATYFFVLVKGGGKSSEKDELLLRKVKKKF